MAPMSMRCNTCGEYIYKGKKFNARQETVRNEDYLGLRIYRFYIKCPCCVSEITFKTDPANTDYAMEHGATRSFQASRIAEKQEEDRRNKEEEDEKTNPMQALEKRTKESRLEMEKLEHLEELRDLNKRHGSVDYEALIAKHLSVSEKTKQFEPLEDDILVKEIFNKKNEDTDEVSGNEKNKEAYKFKIGKVLTYLKPNGALVKPKISKEINNNGGKILNLVNQYSSSDGDD
ncbi:hypothetical protein HZS_283, partial [Henneguya salminicola]